MNLKFCVLVGMVFFLGVSLRKGFRVVVCPFQKLTNHQWWEKTLWVHALHNPLVLGVLHTEWSGQDWGKVPTAMIGWCGQTWLTREEDWQENGNKTQKIGSSGILMKKGVHNE